MGKQIYLTTTLPYVNAEPHIGFALEIVQADAWARTMSLMAYDVVFNTGTDEHGQKIYEKAIAEKKDPQSYTDEYAATFDSLKKALNLSYTHFIRTTNVDHKKAAQEFWRRCLKNGDIYKKNYKMKYCVGCELEKTDSELVNNHCPIHPNLELQTIEEENYFFHFSKYENALLELYRSRPDFVLPHFRLKEIETFVSQGLQDFSISRLRNKMPWGVDVPNDPDHVMYVWFDALVNYISTIGWPKDEQTYSAYWPGYQTAGKDNLRQQSAIWQAMLASAGLPFSQQIFIHGFITSNGQKMSKSLGNVISPYDIVQTYGADAVRFYLLREIPSLDDGDFSHERMKEIYSSELANELGNLVMRLTTIGEKDGLTISDTVHTFDEELFNTVKRYEFNKAVEQIWNDVKQLNKEINEYEPWTKTKEERSEFMTKSLKQLGNIAYHLQPFMPHTAESILASTTGEIKKSTPLFPRLP